MPGFKAKMARAFLNFLDEHGDYRTQLEETAARAAAAEANSLWAKDRRGRKKKRRGRGDKLAEDGEDEDYDDDELEEIAPTPKHPPLPEDPYEQIQFYYRTFKHRTMLQLEERLDVYRRDAANWIHDELHHRERVPALSGSVLAVTVLLYAWRARSKKIASAARVHGVLGKKFDLREYLHANFVLGRVMLRYSREGGVSLGKLREKAGKAEEAALASMRPYQRKKYERFVKLGRAWEWCVALCLGAGMIASGVTLGLSLTALIRGDGINDLSTLGGERLDGHIYSFDGPLDLDGYPIGMREQAEENYAACLADAEERGIEDPTSVCDIDAFFEDAAAASNEAEEEELPLPSTPLRMKIYTFLVTHLRFPPALASYLTTLQTQTIAYLSSLWTFLLFLISHYVAHKIHLATMQNDPMKHFVLSANDKSVKADGTVEAKKGETEAQRKRRERMLQNERLKAKMAQLAMEAKQRVEERRQRIEGEEAVKREKAEEEKKVVEEQEEIVKCHSRQFMMLKAGVPDGAIMNSLLAEGIEEEEANGIIEQLKAIKQRRAKEAEEALKAEAKKREDEEKAEREKEIIAQERLKAMKGQRSASFKRSASSTGNSSIGSTSSITTNGSNSVTFGQGGLKDASLRKTPSRIPYNPAPRPGASTLVSGNFPVGAKSDKRWDRNNKDWVNAQESPGRPKTKQSDIVTSPSPSMKGTPKKSNTSASQGHMPSRLKLGADEEEEEKKGEDESPRSRPPVKKTPPAMPSTTPGLVPASEATTPEPDPSSELATPKDETPSACSHSTVSEPLVLVRISDGEKIPLSSSKGGAFDAFSRPSASDIQSTIASIESLPDEEQPEEGGSSKDDENSKGLAPSWLHSPAFEMALRTSNSSWDRRPSSRDVIAKIRAVEEFEGGDDPRDGVPRSLGFDMDAEKEAADMKLHRSSSRQGDDSLPIIAEDKKITQVSSFDSQRKARKTVYNAADEDDISELSEPTYHSIEKKKDALDGRSIPQALLVPNSKDPSLISPMAQPKILSADASQSTPHPLVPKVETEMERKRRERADARVKKMEAMTARRNAGQGDDEESAVSGMSKRHRIRRKKKAAAELATAVPEETDSVSQKSEALSRSSGTATPAKVETEEDRQRKLRAEARAKKLEAMASRRNANEDDDGTTVTGISRRHRSRRKKSALAAISPEEKRRNEWKKNVFASVLNSEKIQWQTSIYSHVLNAETKLAENLEAKKELDELNASAKRRRENQIRINKKAKKFAARAQRFHAMRAGGGDDDDASVSGSIVSNHMKRRRRKKSAVHKAVPLAEDTPQENAEMAVSP